MHPENNAPFMTKNVNFVFFPWPFLGHSKKTLTNAVSNAMNYYHGNNTVFSQRRNLFVVFFSI